MPFPLINRVKCTLLRSTQFKCLRCVNTLEKITKNRKEGSKPSINPSYQPNDVEANWYELWESKNYFKPSKSESDSYVVLLPPPNITGTLHLGHALTCTIQDVILRWKRMKGESVLWVPGIDHAGIATQVAVEKHLMQTSGQSRHDLGREEFVKAIWKWKNEKAEKIIEQLRKMGASLDWSRLIFTMDASHSHLVNKSFIQLYNEGLIYRKESLVNWSCALKSSISDIEVDWITIDKKENINVPGYDKPISFGLLYEFAYKVCDEDQEIVVATTRPETIFGDVAVAIHPENPETAKFKGKYVWHPFRNEKIPIIVDDFVDPNFGTGAVKITPSHSVTDFEVGLRHKLKSISVINEGGFINRIGTDEKFHGLKRFDARWAVIKELKNLNLFRGSKSHSIKLPVCSRSGDIVEHLFKKQWFLKCNSLVKKAVEVVENGQLKIQPESYKNVWYNWLRTKPSRDWNLSRQLWWGHQIPMYECDHMGKTIWVPGLSLEEVKSKASKMFGAAPGDIKIVQDSDVLDTWFSSGLLSLNTMINQSRYPAISLMVTGHDILFFWLARMVMLSIQLTGELPFKEIFLHGLICDAKGRKMSKSVGNVVHPDDIIYGLSKSEMENRLERNLKEKQMSKENYSKALASQNIRFPKGIPECGVDALRFSLCSNTIQSNFVDFDIERCLANKFFGNKIYQAFNYFIKITDNYKKKRTEFDLEDIKSGRGKLNYCDLWILSRLTDVIQSVDTNLAAYKFDIAADTIRFFIINEFCNFYLNTTKTVLEKCSSDQFKTTVSVFFHCFETSLRLLSPFMPFLTEYLYQAMPLLNGYDKYESITIAKFPVSADWSEFHDVDLESRFKKLLAFLSDLRRAKILFNLSQKPNVFIQCPDNLAEVLFSKMQNVFTNAGGVAELTRVANFGTKNVIQQKIDEDFVIFIEHNYDKSTLLSLFGPTIGKENELKRSLDKLLKTITSPEWEKKTTNEKYEDNKRIKSLNLELKKIEDLKLTVDNCNR